MHNELKFNLNQKSLSFYLRNLLILEEKFLQFFNSEFMSMTKDVNIVMKYECVIELMTSIICKLLKLQKHNKLNASESMDYDLMGKDLYVEEFL
jgi:hypothetical protein